MRSLSTKQIVTRLYHSPNLKSQKANLKSSALAYQRRGGARAANACRQTKQKHLFVRLD